VGSISGSGLSLGTLSVAIVAAVDQALADFQKFGNEVGKVIDEQKTKWEGLKTAGESLSQVGTALTVGLTAPIVAIGAASAKMAGDFEQSLNKIVAVSDATGTDLEVLRQTAMKLGADTKYSAKEAADGMADLAAAGFTTSQVISAMPGVLDLAAAGELGVSRAAEVTAETLGQFGLSAGAAGHVADVFAKGAAASAINVGQLAESMKLVGPVANLAGMSLEQTTAAVALLGNSGLKATEAGTGLRGILAQLESPSKEAAKSLAALGVTVKDAAGNLLPLDQIMKQLKDSGAGATEMFDIFGRESSAAAAILMQQAGPAWAAMTAEIDKSEGAAKKMADTLNSGVNGALEQFKGSVETAGISLGTALAPVIQSLLEIGTKLVNDFLLPAIEWFGSLPAPVQAFVGTIIALAAALGPVLLIAGQLAVAIGALMPVITGIAGVVGVSVVALGGWVIAIAAVVAGLVALGVWVNQNWNGIMAVIQDAVAAVVQKLTDFVNWLAKLVPATSAVGQALHSAAKELGDYSQQAKQSADMNRQLQKTSDDTAAAHKKAAAEAKAAKGAHTDLDTAVKKLTTSQTGLAAGTGDSEEAQKKAAKAAKECAAEYKQLIDKNDVLYAIAQKLGAEHQKLANYLATAALSGHNVTQEFGDGMAPALAKVDAATGLLIGHFDTLTGSNGLPKVLGKLGQVKLAMDPAVGSIASMNSGLETLGITSAAKFSQIAADAQTAYDKIIAAPSATQWEKDSALLKLLEAQRQKMKANGEEIPALMDQQMADIKAKVEGKAPEVKGAFDGMLNSVSTVITNFAQDISKSLWEGDMSWGEKGKKLLTSLGQAVTSSFIEPATKAISDFITGAIKSLLSGDGLGGVLSSLKDIGSEAVKVFGDKGSGLVGEGPISGGIPGGVPGGGSGTGGAGGAASAVGSSLTGWISAISGAVTAISSVIGNFQMAGMNKSLDIIVKHTLQTANDLANLRRDDWDRHNEYALWKDDIVTALWGIQGNTGTAIASLQAIETHCYNASASLAGMLDDSRTAAPATATFMESIVNLLSKIAGKLDVVAAGQMTMTLNGTDPVTVADRIAGRLRLQGATG
jgi:TP901 family phage tail tape measure protein